MPPKRHILDDPDILEPGEIVITIDIAPKYGISNFGNVYNSKFRMKLYYRRDGYVDICLSTINGKENQLVHRLVALAFIPNPDGLPDINHIDGDKTNNNVNNLEWCTKSTNNKKAHDTGLTTKSEKPVKQYTPKGKLVGIFKSTKEASEKTGVGYSGISKVCLGKQETSGGFKWSFANPEQSHGSTKEKPHAVINTKGFPGYLISRKGQVYSINNDLLMETSRIGDGFLRIKLFRQIDGNTESKIIAVHKLVAEAYLPKVSGKKNVQHIDGDITNNCVDNLKWATLKEIAQHNCDTGRTPKPEGKKVALYIDGVKVKVYDRLSEAAKDIGCHPDSITRCIKQDRPMKNKYVWKLVGNPKTSKASSAAAPLDEEDDADDEDDGDDEGDDEGEDDGDDESDDEDDENEDDGDDYENGVL